MTNKHYYINQIRYKLDESRGCRQCRGCMPTTYDEIYIDSSPQAQELAKSSLQLLIYMKILRILRE
jgi:hypothetical protein